jgi:hypothetical protein
MAATAELITVERPPRRLPSAIRCLIRTRIESNLPSSSPGRDLVEPPGIAVASTP